MQKIIVIGGGAAGMMSAIWAGKSGHEVILFERNEKLGKKLFITGKGRCNFTNAAADVEDLLNTVTSNKKFMYSGFYGFSNLDVMNFFEEAGLAYKVERGNRVFPLSDHSSDVIGTLQKKLREYNVDIQLNTRVTDLIIEDSICKGVKVNNKTFLADKVIVATGGKSYSATGSSGDGYDFGKKAGHSLVAPSPSLVPFVIKESLCKELMGLALKNVSITIKSKDKKVYSEFGEMLFTHFGVSGPIIISASAYIQKYVGNEMKLFIDFKPSLTNEQLDDRIVRDFDKYKNKQYKNTLDDLLPKKLIPFVIERSKISPEKKVNEISKTERGQLVDTLKNFQLTILGLRGFEEAIITKGGITVKEIDPSTMESKKTKNLYFCGEVLDVDALTGGYNLQIAWSTAYLAGISV